MGFYALAGFHADLNWSRARPLRIAELPDPGDAAVFLTFDGALVDAADRIEAIWNDSRIATLLSDLHRRTGGRIAIVSGRSGGTLSDLLPGFEGALIGAHGAQRRIGGGSVETAERPEGFDCLREVMKAYAKHHRGVRVDVGPCSVVLQCRDAPSVRARIDSLVERLVEEWDGLVVRHTKTAIEVMPACVSKRAAVRTMHRDWPHAVPVVFGADGSDEGMVRYATEAGGCGIRVGPGETAATHRIDTSDSVVDLLERWLRTGVRTSIARTSVETRRGVQAAF